ncbi:MAG: hypothetical protein QHC90_13345 [Shinella sp.]|nr:hypothetical protein [Shinella sp.]
MKQFVTSAAQGEISIRRISALPADIKPLAPELGKYIIGHSETGHHHVMTLDRKQAFEATNAPTGMRILYANLEAAGELVHERGHDTHETISFEPGIYEFRLGREYDPYAELARKVAD